MAKHRPRGRRESHGMTGTPEHKAYDNMLSRCYSDSYRCAHRYSDRNIYVCDRWVESFLNFL